MKTITRIKLYIFSLILVSFFFGCNRSKIDIEIPESVPASLVPADNSFTKEKAVLGRFLFYDKRLSGDDTMSCASCHDVSLAFTDGMVRPRGIPNREGGLGPRNAPNLTNAGFSKSYTWINPGLKQLENQALVPLFLDNIAIEMGLAGKENQALEKIKKEDNYQELFAAAFPHEENRFTIGNVVRAIASFERTFISFNSPYDHYINGDNSAISESAISGKDLFFSDQLKCSQCHSGKFFSDAQDRESKNKKYFHDNGIHNKYPDNTNNVGLSEVSLSSKDVGKFKTPTLRNVAYTYPFMHDGSISCNKSLQKENGTSYSEKCARQALSRVIDNYAKGGKKSTNQDTRISGFSISPKEKKDLIEFLLTLSDPSFLSQPFYRNPRPDDPHFGR